MKRASQNDKLFNCLYHPLEPGVYTTNVQWSEHHIRGSPFKMFVAQSEMDLLEYQSQLDRSRDSSSKSSSKRSPKIQLIVSIIHTDSEEKQYQFFILIVKRNSIHYSY